MNFTPRRALVTGGTRGIGKEIAISFRNAGYNVVVFYANNDAAAKEFTKETGITAIKCDVSNFESCQVAVSQATDVLGGNVEVLVNNAGITRDSMLHKMLPEQWNDVVNTNLNSVFNVTRQVIEGMRADNFGRIINISSVNARGCAGQTNYSATKSGVEGFGQSLALENASKGITVNTVAPGYVDTEMVRQIPQPVLDQIVNKVPAKRLGSTHEVANVILYLTSDDAGFITGAVIPINGGLRTAAA